MPVLLFPICVVVLISLLSPPITQADSKWKERKEVLEAVLPTAQAIKLQPGDHGELLKALKKVCLVLVPFPLFSP